MIDYSSFNHWFELQTDGSYKIISGDSFNNKIIREADITNETPEFLDESLHADFYSFATRPEYAVGKHIELNGQPVSEVIESFKNLLTGTLLIRAKRANQDPDSHIMQYIQKILNWLESTDFYEAPASTIYHESFKHGLLYHTISVYNQMLELHKIPKFNSIPLDSATLCCLCHDWCKIDFYESYMRNVKNETTGQWERVASYKCKESVHPFGHGTSSMYMSMKMFKLTEEEALSIRWHMSMFNVASNEINDYQLACEKYPLVHLLQFADQLSIVDY